MLHNEQGYYIAPESKVVWSSASNVKSSSFKFSIRQHAMRSFCFADLGIDNCRKRNCNRCRWRKEKKLSHLVDIRNGAGQRIYKRKQNYKEEAKRREKNSAAWWIQPQVMIFTLSCWTFTWRVLAHLWLKGENNAKFTKGEFLKNTNENMVEQTAHTPKQTH